MNGFTNENPPMLIDAPEQRLKSVLVQMRDEQTREPLQHRQRAIDLVATALCVLEAHRIDPIEPNKNQTLQYVVGVDVAKEGHTSQHSIRKIEV